MKIIKLILQYLIGLYLILSGLVFALSGIGVFGGLIMLISGLIIFPNTRNWIENKLNFQFNKLFKYSVPFIGVILPIFFINTERLESFETNTSNNYIVDSLNINHNNTLTNKDDYLLSKTITDSLKNERLEEPKKEINSNTIKLLSIKSSSLQKKKDSIKETELSNEKASVNTLHEEPQNKPNINDVKTSKKRKKYSKKKKRKSYRTTSGVCGAKNRSKSGYCRRKVKGGGRCWQH